MATTTKSVTSVTCDRCGRQINYRQESWYRVTLLAWDDDDGVTGAVAVEDVCGACATGDKGLISRPR